MNRDRAYYRSQRKRAICRKRRILLNAGGQESLYAWTHGAEGRLSKGKIHCSCPMCRLKSYDNPGLHDKRSSKKAQDMILDYYREEDPHNERNHSQQAERN